MSQLDLKVLIAMARTHSHVFQKIEKQIESYGLNMSEFGVLEVLFHKGDLPVQEIAKKILVTSGTITYVINKLLKKGFVEKKQCSNDRRIFYISLTEKGYDFIKKIFPDHAKYIEGLFNHLNVSDKKDFIRILNSIENMS